MKSRSRAFNTALNVVGGLGIWRSIQKK
jgi:hypothetical protein